MRSAVMGMAKWRAYRRRIGGGSGGVPLEDAKFIGGAARDDGSYVDIAFDKTITGGPVISEFGLLHSGGSIGIYSMEVFNRIVRLHIQPSLSSTDTGIKVSHVRTGNSNLEGFIDKPLSNQVTIVEDEAFDIKVGSFLSQENGFSISMDMGSLPTRVEIDGKALVDLRVHHSDTMMFMQFEGYLGAFNAASLDVTLGLTGQVVTLPWDNGLKMYTGPSIAATNYFNVNDDDLLAFIIHAPTSPPPDPGDGTPFDDLDGDGNPDTVIYEDGLVTVTEDADSYNIDLDGDGVIDIEVHK